MMMDLKEMVVAWFLSGSEQEPVEASSKHGNRVRTMLIRHCFNCTYCKLCDTISILFSVCRSVSQTICFSGTV
jgi:hypothetical protein